MSDVIFHQSVSSIPVNTEGKILLQLRDDRPKYYPNCWTMFGGAVEAGETPDEAMRRELLEEIELELPLTLWKILETLVERDGQQIAWENTIYVGFIDRAASEIKLNEGQALGYFGPDELDKLQIAHNFEPLFREFFAALADGTIPL